MTMLSKVFCGALTAASLCIFSATPSQAATLSQECLSVDRVAKPRATIYFPVDSTTISAKDQEILTRVAYDGQSQSKVCVIGQADKQGNSAYNTALAGKRAAAVSAFLKSKGLSNSLVDSGARTEAFNDLLDVIGKQKQDRRVDVYFITNAER